MLTEITMLHLFGLFCIKKMNVAEDAKVLDFMILKANFIENGSVEHWF